ncbi:MAG: AMP-binding protein [Chitinophagales bacterium]|nr:AMP-binding protein [Chitinophagales bacterium]
MFTIRFSTNTPAQIIEEAKAKLAQDNLSNWERDIWTFTEAFLNPGNQSFTVFTSGSTGKPKLIKHSRFQLEQSARATISFFSLEKAQQVLLAIPAAKIGGRMMIVRSILAQLDMSCVPLSSKPLNGVTINNTFDFAPFTPMQLSNCLSDAATKKKVEKIRTILLGGGEVSNVLLQQVQRLPIALFHSYGMTETASHIALRALNGADASSCYKTLPGITVSANEHQCLQISAPHFFKGKLTTNDVAVIHSDTSFEWIGRSDNVINSGGIKIQPETVEKQLFSLLPYRFFIAGVSDAVLGKRVVLVIESSKCSSKEVKQLASIFNTHLTKFEQPKSIVLVHKFRETETGKIQRAETLLHAIQQIDVK